MSKRTNEELVKIITIDKDGYLPIGIETAQAELDKREISATEIEAIEQQLKQLQQEEEERDRLTPSSLVRLANAIIDNGIILFLFIPISFLIGFLAMLLPLPITIWVVYLVYALSYFAYYAFMETKYQKTIGKFVTKTHVATASGAKPNFNVIAIRTLLRWIPIDWFSFLFVTNGFHDSLSNTRVLKDTSPKQ